MLATRRDVLDCSRNASEPFKQRLNNHIYSLNDIRCLFVFSQFIYDGVDLFQGLHFAQLADNIFEKCTKVLSGYEKWGVVNDKMRQFQVLEMHQYNSTTAQQIFSPVRTISTLSQFPKNGRSRIAS